MRNILQPCWYIWPWRGPLPVCGLPSRWKNWTTQSLSQPAYSSRILSVIQTRASKFRGHRQAYTSSIRRLVWMRSSDPWKVVTGETPRGHFHRTSQTMFSLPKSGNQSEVNYWSPWRTNLDHIATASDGRNIVLWVTLIFYIFSIKHFLKTKISLYMRKLQHVYLSLLTVSYFFSCAL